MLVPALESYVQFSCHTLLLALTHRSLILALHTLANFPFPTLSPLSLTTLTATSAPLVKRRRCISPNPPVLHRVSSRDIVRSKTSVTLVQPWSVRHIITVSRVYFLQEGPSIADLKAKTASLYTIVLDIAGTIDAREEVEVISMWLWKSGAR